MVLEEGQKGTRMAIKAIYRSVLVAAILPVTFAVHLPCMADENVKLEFKRQKGELLTYETIFRMEVAGVPETPKVSVEVESRSVSVVNDVSSDGIVELIDTTAVQSVRASLGDRDTSDELLRDMSDRLFEVSYQKKRRDGSVIESRRSPSKGTSLIDVQANLGLLWKLPKVPMKTGGSWGETMEIAELGKLEATFALGGFEKVRNYDCVRIKGDMTGAFHFGGALGSPVEGRELTAAFALEEGMMVHQKMKLEAGVTAPTGGKISYTIEVERQLKNKETLTPIQLEETKEELKVVEAGRSLLAKGKPDTAKVSFEKFIQEHPKSVWSQGVEKLIAGIEAKSAVKPPTGFSVGQAAPDFTLDDINGRKFSLSKFSGKVVFLDFWSPG